MAKKRSSSQTEKAPITAPKDDQPPTPAPEVDEKPSPPHPEEDKVKEDEDEDSTSAASSSSEGEDDDEDDEEAEDDDPPSSQPQPASKNITPPAKSNFDEEDDEDDEEETDSESEEEPTPKLKSLNSNSSDQIAKPKSEAKPSLAPARSGTKRPVDNDPKQAKKRKTTADSHGKEPEEDNKKSGEDSKKLFQRVFTDDDEVAIVKGLYDFITKTGNDPFKYHTAFYEYVKKSIHSRVTLEQLRDKMRRLRQRYETKAKSGKTPNFIKAKDKTMFELGQKIWGGKLNDTEAEEKGKPNGRLSKREPAAKKPSTTKKLVLEPDSQVVVLKETKKEERTDKDEPGSSLALNELIRFEAGESASRSKVDLMLKKGLELMEESKMEELKRRWEKVQIAELEVHKMKVDLAADHGELLLDALKSSSD